jgi:hypothetical protein
MSVQPTRQPVYFLPDRIMVYVEHPVNAFPEARALAELVKATAADWGGSDLESTNPERIKSFPVKDASRVLSMVPATVPKEQVTSIVKSIYRRVEGKSFRIAGEKATEVLLTAVSPVWLMTAGPHGISHGGPGGLPVRAENPNGNLHCFTFPDMQISEPAEQGGQDVTVLILDTAPSDGLVEAARDKYAGKHPLVDSLLINTKSRLKIHRCWRDELADIEKTYGVGVDVYRMSDHGLFVAGIVNSIAPKAELHLYEVLNRFGVGTFDTIAEGLLRALKMRNANPDNRLIVNCSLMLGAPEPHDDQEDQPDSDLPELLTNPEIYTYMNRPFQDIIMQLDQAGITVVAAAGNDAQDEADPDRPWVRYPAAFDGAIAVGALPIVATSNGPWNRASYSNEAHRRAKDQGQQVRQGFLTLGGEKNVDKGVLGIYLDVCPRTTKPHTDGNGHTFDDDYEYEPANNTGWAWWSGTSFATPIITGLLARTRATHINGSASRSDDENKLTTLSRNGGPAHEKVIYAKQGSC